MFKAKVVVVGPPESGKSVLSNFLGDQTDISQSRYHPTVGVRVLEFETPVDNGRTFTNMDIELWDCSGNENYEGCWPAMAYKADGVVIACDAYKSSDLQAVENLYSYFVANRGLKPTQCLIYASCKNKEAKTLKSPVASVPIMIGSTDKNSEDLRDAFKNFLQRIYGKLADSRDKEELQMMS
ncbi:intraflagellar transport protein 22 homolog [Clavelina lepadiformis]|uniref:intraflagellar transport protein 22 homolog n=1 Tax=Clavelina lepadiformis TaxID=159417 RepID=UPI004041A982